MRVIRTPSGRAVSLKVYVSVWKKLKTLPPETEVPGWEWYPVEASRILKDMQAGMMDRINRAVPYSSVGAYYATSLVRQPNGQPEPDKRIIGNE